MPQDSERANVREESEIRHWKYKCYEGAGKVGGGGGFWKTFPSSPTDHIHIYAVPIPTESMQRSIFNFVEWAMNNRKWNVVGRSCSGKGGGGG